MGVVIIAAVVATAQGLDRVVVALTAFTIVAFLGLFISSYVINMQRQQRTRQAVLASEPCLHWRYTASEWQGLLAHPQVQTQMQQQATRWRPFLLRNAQRVSLPAALMVLLLLFNKGLAGVIGAAVVGLVLFALGLRSAARIQHSLVNPYTLATGQETAVYISPRGIVLPEQTMLFQPHIRVVNATVEPGDPSLVRIVTHYRVGRNQAMPYELFIPVPQGHIAAAETLVERLRTT